MNWSPGGTRILFVDRQDHWRTSMSRALADAGFAVTEAGELKMPAGELSADLVVVGCARIGPQELELIRDISKGRHPLVVFATYLPWDAMRSAFLAGAADVTEKTYDPERVVDVVRQMLETIASRDQYMLARG